MTAPIRFEVKAGDVDAISSDLCIVYLVQDRKAAPGPAGAGAAEHLGQVAREDRFDGRPGRTLLWHAAGDGWNSRRHLIVGLGPAEELTLDRYRRYLGRALVEADRLGAST
ncbi:MAG TPA: M17 family peptidase N-terminal domain-containing protein, partial [Candidatus Polarisedimenticolia bacterium]|nr:M17 family peptidase N-terminal domain-containing protein [Candidatus Polarisedimenticolia bacterium]